MKRPECPTCTKPLSTGASRNGKEKFFCVNPECPDRFIDITNTNVTIEIPKHKLALFKRIFND